MSQNVPKKFYSLENHPNVVGVAAASEDLGDYEKSLTDIQDDE